MATPSGLSAPSPRPDWLTRNWKWAVPLGVLVLMFLFASFVGTLFFIVETSFRDCGCYVQAMARARSNPQVAEKIGQPLQAGWLSTGSINTSGSSGNADISIPISGPKGKGSGPKGKGTLYVVAKKRAGLWKFETLQVEVDGDAERITLLLPGEMASNGRE